MRIAVCDDCRQDACAVRELLSGQEVKLYGSAESLLLDVEQDGRVQECTGKLNNLEQQICVDMFLRCHQSFIVNVYHVREIAGIKIVLTEEGEKVLLSRCYYAAVQERNRKLLFEEVGWE